MKTLTEAISELPTPRDRIEVVTEELVANMRQIGIDPTPYSIAIRIAAETLTEREKAYTEYMEKGGRQTTEKGRSEATAVRLAAWNSQARACLSMLKLTPWRVRPTETEDEESE